MKASKLCESETLQTYSSILLHRLTEMHAKLYDARSPATLSVLDSCRVLVDHILSSPCDQSALLNNQASLETFFQDLMKIYTDPLQLPAERGLYHLMKNIQFVERSMTDAREKIGITYTHLVESIVERSILKTQNYKLLHQITVGPYISQLQRTIIEDFLKKSRPDLLYLVELGSNTLPTKALSTAATI